MLPSSLKFQFEKQDVFLCIWGLSVQGRNFYSITIFSSCSLFSSCSTSIYGVCQCLQYLVILSLPGLQENTFCSFFEINQVHVTSSGQSNRKSNEKCHFYSGTMKTCFTITQVSVLFFRNGGDRGLQLVQLTVTAWSRVPH